jgi:D-alanyl-D-alanine carboxypeptidase
VVVLVAALMAGCAPDAEQSAVEADAADDVERVVAEAADDHAVGVLALIDHPDATLVSAAGLPEGTAGRDLGGEAFRVASVTKMVTAAVALQLVEEGELDLDDRVAELVPERADAFEYGDEITLRQVLGHTSGVRDFIRHPDYLPDLVRHGDVRDGMAVGSCEDLAAVNPFDYAGGPAAFEPGAGFEYSNAGYLLAGEAIEEVTGDDLADVYRERVLDPLDLDATWLACDESPRAELVAGYHAPGSFGFTIPGQDDAPVEVTGVDDPNLWAGGGLVSTADDLVVLARALFTGELFADADTLETMVETTEHRPYGLGVEVEDGIYGHGGLAAGYGVDVRYATGRDAVVVVMVNETAEDLPAEVAASIMGLFDPTRS